MATLFDPFDALVQFQQALDSYRTSGWLGAGPSARGGYPPINIFRKGDDVVAIAEVPGISKSDLEIQVHGKTVRIAGRKAVEYGDKASLHRRERLTGRFDRAFTVPFEIDADQVKAECRDGMLALFLTRAERDKPRAIAVADASDTTGQWR
jgi:HSP20 family protein